MLVSIKEWAKAHFKNPPCAATLRVIAKTKQTYPPAIKQGRRWLIDESAEFIGIVGTMKVPDGLPEPVQRLIEKAINGGTSKKLQN